MPFSAKPTGLSMATIYNGSNPAIAYANDVLATNPIAYWKLNEGSGATITDSSGNGYDGSYTGVTWDGTTFLTDPVPFWDGVNDRGDVYSAAFGSAFDMDEFTVLLWLKANSSSVWTNGASNWFFRFERDANNLVQIFNSATNNNITYTRVGNATTKTQGINSFSDTEFFSILLSCSVAGGGLLDAGDLRCYKDGVQIGVDQTGNIASAGSGLSATGTVIGALNNGGTFSWDGYISQMVVWDSPVDASKLALATV